MKKLFVAALLSLAVAGTGYAQGCSVCTKTAQGLGDKSAKGLNKGIIYLAFLPASIMGTIGYFWWRSRNSQA